LLALAGMPSTTVSCAELFSVFTLLPAAC